MNIKKTANLLLNFAIKRLAETFGILIFLVGLILLISLFSYSPNDPNFIFPENTQIKNYLGFKGIFISDLFFQSFGLIAYLISFTFILTGINIFRTKKFFLIIDNIFFSILYSIFGTFFLTFFYSSTFSLYINGNGGFIGDYLNQTFLNSLVLISSIGFISSIDKSSFISLNSRVFSRYSIVSKFETLFLINSKACLLLLHLGL